MPRGRYVVAELHAKRVPKCPRAAECCNTLDEAAIKSALSAKVTGSTGGVVSSLAQSEIDALVLDWHDLRTATLQDAHPLLRACREPDCHGRVSLTREALRDGTPVVGECSECRRSYCCQCLAYPHAGRSCAEAQSLAEKWVGFLSSAGAETLDAPAAGSSNDKTTGDDGASGVKGLGAVLLRLDQQKADRDYLRRTCKRCPQCRRIIEKVSGCDAMVCGRDYHSSASDQQGGCGASFNWGEVPTIDDDDSPQIAAAANLRLDTKTPQADLTTVSATSAPVAITCDQCAKDIVGTRFSCVRCEGNPSLCFSCLRVNLSQDEAAAAAAKRDGRGGPPASAPKHVEHLFEVVQPAQWGLPTAAVVGVRLSERGDLSVEGAKAGAMLRCRSSDPAVPHPSGSKAEGNTESMNDPRIHVGNLVNGCMPDRSSRLAAAITQAESHLGGGHAHLGFGHQRAPRRLGRACEYDAVLVQVDVFTDGRVVFSEMNRHGCALGWLSLDTISYALAKPGADDDEQALTLSTAVEARPQLKPLRVVSCGSLRACVGDAIVPVPKMEVTEEEDDQDSEDDEAGDAKMADVGHTPSKSKGASEVIAMGCISGASPCPTFDVCMPAAILLGEEAGGGGGGGKEVLALANMVYIPKLDASGAAVHTHPLPVAAPHTPVDGDAPFFVVHGEWILLFGSLQCKISRGQMGQQLTKPITAGGQALRMEATVDALALAELHVSSTKGTLRRLEDGTPVNFGDFSGCTVVNTNSDGSVDVDVPGPGVERHVARSRVSPLDGSSNEVDAEPSTAGLASARIAGKAFPVMLRISPDGSLAWVRTAIDAGDVQMASPSAIRASFDVQDTPDAQVRIHLAGVRMRRPPPQPPAGGTDQARKLAITATSSVSTPLETAAGPRQRRAHLTYGPNVGGPGVSPSSAAAEAAPAPAPRAQSGMRRLPDGTHISYSSYSGCTIVRTNPDGSVDVDIPGPGVERNVARSRVSPLDGSSNTAELEPLGSVEWVPPIVAPLQTSVSVQEPPSEWACARCTLVNQASNAKCEACDADRPPREVLPPDKSAGGKDVTEEARYLPAEAAKQGDFGYMRGVVLKRTEDGHDVAVWRPGDVICRLDRNLRPRQKTSSVVLAGAAHGLRGVITAIKKQRSDQHRQEETERQLREERLEARRKHRTQRRRFRRMLSDPSTVRTELPNSFEEILNDMPDHAAVVSLITRNADRLIQLRLFESSTGISVAFTEVIKKAVEFVDDEFAAPIFRALLPPLLTRICAPQPEYVTVNQAVGALHWLAHNANLLDDSGVKAAFFPYRVQLSTALVAYSDNPLAAREGFAEPHAHAPLVRHPDEAVDTDFICDHCHQDMVGLRMRFTCPAGCDFDACEACFVKIYGDGASRLEPDGIIAGEGEFGCDLCGHEHIDASINCIEMYRWVLSRLV